MAGDQTNQSNGLTSRREALRKGVVIGGMALWVTPVVQTIGMTGAFAQTTSGAGGHSGGGGSTGGSTGGTTDGGTTDGGTTAHSSTGSSPSEPLFEPNDGAVESSSQTASAPSNAGGSQGTLARTGVDAEHVGEVGLAATALGVALTAISRIKESPSEDPNFDGEGYE